MAASSFNFSEDAEAKSVRIPSLPGRRHGGDGPSVDVNSEGYKAGFDAASREFLAQLEEQEAWHEDFAKKTGEMLAEMDARYRSECLTLITRLFAAAAPTLARRSSLADIMQLIEERVVQGKSDLVLRVHPTLAAHLPDKESRVLASAPEVTLIRDESCAPAMIDAKWKDGGLFHDPDGLIEEVMRALEEEAAPLEETSDE
ncbi:hypothetical protein [Hyphococcus luteus]|uniref:Flagellar assembly protein FliH/Type III secretion system HrpE domain-containing protein n=1 Tax=Hyphococcus luteus TaxID=2058213 RepID=A0A2S7K4J4_9PROT|nr:hypothetical protein [Marinicaulis flavus]PQA87427.1 hypothetical protein CW354_11520 [Marinicaulis flavus]